MLKNHRNLGSCGVEAKLHCDAIAESLSEKGYYFHYSIQENKVQLTDH